MKHLTLRIMRRLSPVFVALAVGASAQAIAENVTVGNLVRAESDPMFRATMAARGIGVREPVQPQQLN